MCTENLPHTYDPETPYGKLPEIPEISDREFDETLRLAIATYGKESQTRMLFEEMAELQNALCKLSRGRATEDQVCEEIADVMIMCLQMAMIHGWKSVENWTNLKVIRLKSRLTSSNHPDSLNQNSQHNE